MVRLILLRHGEAPKKTIKLFGIPIKRRSLTPKGKSETKKVAKSLLSWKIDKIISSDMKRAKQTTSIVSKIICKKFSFDPRIRERCPSLETNNEFIERCRSFLLDMEKETGTILVSTHGGTIRTILAISTKNRRDGRLVFNSVKPEFSKFSIIDFKNKKWRIQTINCQKTKNGNKK